KRAEWPAVSESRCLDLEVGADCRVEWRSLIPMNDLEFLTLLVHRGHVPREQARDLFSQCKSGAPLDGLLARELGGAEPEIQKLRRARCGEIPELPGYEILSKLGSGGTADVFQAREKATKRVLALKVLRSEAARHESTRKSFVAEARMLERLHHSGLVGCYGV